MKYWRGYLVAAILAACTWAFREFAEAHSKLVDMIYPYVTRMVQNFMANWSSGVDFCLWQAILLALVVLAVASIVLMIIFKWNPIQWFGWIVAAASLVLLLHTGVFGMNEFAGPIAEDIRLGEVEDVQEKMEDAAVYYRDMANALASQTSGSSMDLQKLNEQAENGFKNLVYQNYYSVFAGSTLPIKELGYAQWFTQRGEMGYTVAITGEAALNPETPEFMKPFAVCREMCYRMCIASQRDKHFGAFLACQANENADFRYAGYVMAYRYCLNALPADVASTVHAKADAKVREDVATWDAFVEPAEKLAAEKAQKEGLKDTTNAQIADLLTRWHYQQVSRSAITRWHYQQVVIPSITEPEVEFDPYDESQVDLTGLPHVTTEAAE